MNSRARTGVAIFLAVVMAAAGLSVVLATTGGGSSNSTSSRPTEAPTTSDQPRAKVELRRVVKLLPRDAPCPVGKQAKAPNQTRHIWCDPVRSESYLLGPIELGTADITDAEAVYNESAAAYVVVVTLSREGASKFESVTRDLAREAKVGRKPQLAIVVDGIVISAPRVERAIAQREVQITAAFTEDRAKELASSIAP